MTLQLNSVLPQVSWVWFCAACCTPIFYIACCLSLVSYERSSRPVAWTANTKGTKSSTALHDIPMQKGLHAPLHKAWQTITDCLAALVCSNCRLFQLSLYLLRALFTASRTAASYKLKFCLKSNKNWTNSPCLTECTGSAWCSWGELTVPCLNISSKYIRMQLNQLYKKLWTNNLMTTDASLIRCHFNTACLAVGGQPGWWSTRERHVPCVCLYPLQSKCFMQSPRPQ